MIRLLDAMEIYYGMALIDATKERVELIKGAGQQCRFLRTRCCRTRTAGYPCLLWFNAPGTGIASRETGFFEPGGTWASPTRKKWTGPPVNTAPDSTTRRSRSPRSRTTTLSGSTSGDVAVASANEETSEGEGKPEVAVVVAEAEPAVGAEGASPAGGDTPGPGEGAAPNDDTAQDAGSIDIDKEMQRLRTKEGRLSAREADSPARRR